MREHWHVCEKDSLSQALSRALGIHPLTAQCLINRGIRTHADASHFLEPLSRKSQDTAALYVAERIRTAVESRQRVLIFGDSDVDGITASVILFETIERLGGQAHA